MAIRNAWSAAGTSAGVGDDQAMTTSAFDPADTASRPCVRIGDPGDLLAALPAMLGFAPERSIVVACLRGSPATSVGPVMRFDFVLPESGTGVSGELSAVLRHFVAICAREGADAVVVLVIDDSGAPTLVYTDAVDEFADRLDAVGISVKGAYFAARLAAGEPWWSLFGDARRGRVPDPHSSSLAVAHVLEGRQIRSSRTDLEALLDRAEPAERAEVSALVGASVPVALRTCGVAPIADSLERVLWLIDDIADGHVPTPWEIAETGRALDDPLVRDSLLALAAGPLAPAAEALWLTAARVLPDSHRAAAATLVGFGAYLAGEGALARIALTSALESDPEYRLAVLLDASLSSGLRPETLGGLVESAYGVAGQLGVELPVPTQERR